MKTSRITPRRGKAISTLAVEHYGAYHAGEYRGTRDVWLLVARHTREPALRQDRIRHAIDNHRAMMRCLREIARERALQAKLDEMNNSRVTREWSEA